MYPAITLKIYNFILKLLMVFYARLCYNIIMIDIAVAIFSTQR